ncbi:MAG TPA: gamma-glutamylcyclotransferase family protein [Steroidobacteraceae bacterium]|nr:gamma-glutamylcyclotransferase family protein [Steroidobacteraceae bacterium]
MNERHIDGFFYGLFMDVNVLRNSGVVPVNPRKAYVDGFALQIGNRATPIPFARARAYGMVMALTHSELERLYGAPGLDQYRAEAVLAGCMDGGTVPALCYNLLVEPQADERNQDYAARLRKVLGELNFPEEYVNSI